MPLFQKSVLHKYLKGLNNNKVNAAFEQFTAYFHNPTIQENIRNSKEEQFQATFLNELFVKILGYTLNPKPDFNLTTEFKNIKGAKKADGAILKKDKAHGVIELKGTNTTDLGKVESQAFGYKNNHPTCKYIITSNFEKLRFYIEDAVDFEEFDLFNLKAEQFALLYLCLHKDQLLKDVALKIKKDSTLQEENVTKKLYKDYSAFKKALFNDLVKNNPEHNQLVLFKKSQKLLDRFLFIFFAEDKGLLRPNSISKIVKMYETLEDLDNYKPLYQVVQQYFGYINTGRKPRKNRAEIFAFNGGLFAPDELLDCLTISDGVLMNHCLILSKYDFDSEVDVNILGHIFEHSLNEIDEMTATIEGRTIDKNKTKRKKDGVFYTPKYITKYIVENTVGKLCEEQKQALGIDENEYRPKRNKSTKKRLLGLLEQYRNYLLDLTICDPACGSGAFLNQALDFLIQEHRYIDELQTKLLGGSIVLSDITNDILERNIYGVDINEESVEIARLSLWLRTARKGRTLTNLSSNIKCGNSLIDNSEVAREKAFKWEEEFPKVFIPKDLQAFHVVLTTHNSRVSKRMIKQKIAQGEAVELTTKEEIELSKIIKDIIIEKDYKCLSYNICKDHVHLILVCDIEELATIVGTIKGKASKLFNELVSKGLKPLGENVSDAKVVSKPIPSKGFQPLASNAAYSNSKKIKVKSELTHKGLKPLGKNTIETKVSPNQNIQSKGFQPLACLYSPLGNYIPAKHQNHLWSQKFYRAELDVWELATLSKKTGYLFEDIHLGNAMSYIATNREKHNLPAIPKLQPIINDITCSQTEAFKVQYKGGFNVIIGNPPYVRQELIKPFKPYLEKNYKTYQGTADLFTYFIEISADRLLNENGLYSIIVANKWMRANYGKPLRQWMKQKRIIEIIDFGDLPVFSDATAYPCILTLSPKSAQPKFWTTEPKHLQFSDLEGYVEQNRFSVKTESLNDKGWALVDERISDLLDKLKSKGIPLKEYVNDKIYYGIKTGLNEAFVIDETTKNKLIAEDPKSPEIIKPFLAGRDVKRYAIHFQETYLILVPAGWTNKHRGNQEAWTFFKNTYPAIADYLQQHEVKAKKRYDKGDYWWELRACAYYDEFEKSKIMLPDISRTCNAAYDIEGRFYLVNTAYIILTPHESLTCKLNSKLLNFYYGGISPSIRGGYFRFIYQYLAVLPIITDQIIDDKLKQISNKIHKIKKRQLFLVSRLLRRLQSSLSLEKPSKKLQSFYNYDFKTFVSELKKKKIELSLMQQDKWEEYFSTYKTEINQLQAKIDKTDKEIDKMVYELYGLTEEEIEIVETA